MDSIGPAYIDPDEVLAATVHLFAHKPMLPQKLIERARADKAANKPSSFFDYLFEGTSHPVVGVSYQTVGYQLRKEYQ